MPSLVGLLFAVRVATLASPAPPPQAISFREQARLVAAEAAADGAKALDAAYAARAPQPAVDARALVRPDRRVRAGDVFAALARQLHVDETPVGKVAVWVATRPVQVDWSPHHVFVRATLVGP